MATKLLAVFENFTGGIIWPFSPWRLALQRSGHCPVQSFGFRQAGRRKNYYDLPKEDALILTKTYGEAEA